MSCQLRSLFACSNYSPLPCVQSIVTSKTFQDTSGDQTAECTAEQRTSIEQGHSQVQLLLGVPLREVEEDTGNR
jgi:hypothetical protein